MNKEIIEQISAIGGIAVFSVMIAVSFDGAIGVISGLAFFGFFTYKILEAYSASSGIKSE